MKFGAERRNDRIADVLANRAGGMDADRTLTIKYYQWVTLSTRSERFTRNQSPRIRLPTAFLKCVAWPGSFAQALIDGRVGEFYTHRLGRHPSD